MSGRRARGLVALIGAVPDPAWERAVSLDEPLAFEVFAYPDTIMVPPSLWRAWELDRKYAARFAAYGRRTP